MSLQQELDHAFVSDAAFGVLLCKPDGTTARVFEGMNDEERSAVRLVLD